MQSLKFANLDFGDRLALFWSFFWRGIIITIGSMLAGGVLGFIFGFVSAAVGLEAAWGPLGASLLGFAAGLCLFYVYVWWLLSARLGRFKLQLVAAS